MKYHDIPHSIKELTSLKGVVIKMATLCMADAWREQVGIGVDVHVHRISNLLNWVHTNHPNKTECELKKVFPENLWESLNQAVVGFGQTICGSKKQKCNLCPISDSCPKYNGIESDDIKKSKKLKNQKKKIDNYVSDDYESDIDDFVVDDKNVKDTSETDFSEYD